MNNTHKYLNQLANNTNVNKVNYLDSINQVEIVVPIFNGFKIVKNCIAKLLKHTSKIHTITLLNDASTNVKLNEYLQQKSQQHEHIQLVTRENNLGYLKNINSHLKNTKKAVVLLNSDTKVTTGWLEAMLEVASDSRIGVVCPLSNNASILSLPNIRASHIKHLSKLIGLWFPIPTAVGFCMLIKPGLWKKLKGFDPYYDPGYGEECDFSMLVRQNGLQIGCSPAAYVDHQGSQSFKNQSILLQQQHQHLLDLRWPSFTQEVNQFIATNPVNHIKQWLINQINSKPRVLHIVHSIKSKGGVELFTKSLVESFDDKFHHTILLRKHNKSTQIVASSEIIEIDMLAFKPEHIIFNLPADLYNHKLDLYFKDLLQWGSFKYVHFHSTVGIGTNIWPQICYHLEIPYALFFHDHSGLCQIFSLSSTIKKQEIYCGKLFAEAKDRQCKACIQSKTQKTQLTTESYLDLRTQIWNDNIQNAHQLQFCSDYLIEMYTHKFSNIEHKATVLNPCFFEHQITPTKRLSKAQVNVAFLGQFGRLKGAQLFIDLYHYLSDQNIKWQIIGGIDPKYQQQLDHTDIVTTGAFDGTELPQLLHCVDIIVFTSQIPEAYGITLTEAMVNGIPVVAPNLGTYSSRVKNQKNGILYQTNNLESLANALTQLITLQKSQNHIKQIVYQAPNKNPSTILKQNYKTGIRQTNNHSFDGTQTLLDPPKTNAYQIMQKWLDAPMTLEAENDWSPAPAGLHVLILGSDNDLIQQTTNSLRQHLINPIIYTQTPDIFHQLTEECLLFLITAGNNINENMGNWLTYFTTNQAVASLADFALHNYQQQSYAPQFEGAFSWQTLSNNKVNIGCLLLKPQLIHELAKQSFFSTQLNFQNILYHLYQHHNNQVTHFPYFAYTMADHQFVNHWKHANSISFHDTQKSTNKVFIFIETQLKGMALTGLKKQFQSQNWDPVYTISMHFYSTSEKSSINHLIDLNNASIFIIADNILLTDNNCLQTMLNALNQSSVDALTIPAAKGNNNHNLIAKKAGAANHFQSIGLIKDLRFTHQNTVHEHEWLDDDFYLFSNQAWIHVAKTYFNDFSLYTTLKLSAKLQKNGFSIGVFATNHIYKQGLPTRCKSELPINLNNQRQDVINLKAHIPIKPHYPKAYSCRKGSQLDLIMTAFKTPKKVPRVIAYAQDNWASGFYRIKSPMNALAADNKISVHFLATNGPMSIPTPYEIHRMQADVLLLHGFYSDQQLAALNQYTKQTNIRVVISIDDLLTHIPKYNPFSHTIPKDIKIRLKLACSLADNLIVSSVELAEQFTQYHPKISVIPNRLSQQVWPTQIKVKNTPQRIRIGWAGAGQHQGDLEWLIPVIEQTQGFCDWVFFGDKPSQLNQHLLEFHQPVHILEYPKKLQQLNLNLGIAPLVDNPFNRAKSSLKLIEYGVLGLPVIASNLPCYQNSPAVLLENDSNAWINQIKTFDTNKSALIENGRAMLNWMHQGYWLEEHQNQWLKVLGINESNL